MQITAVEAIPVVVPKTHPFTSSLGTFDRANAGVVRIRTSDGIEGVGEIVSLWHGGGGVLCKDVNSWFGPALVGQNPLEIVRMHALIEKLCQFGCHTNPMRAAIDMALYDIMGKALGVPVYVLLGGKCRESIELSMSVHMGSYDEMLAQATGYVEAGFRTVKVKVGVDPERDLKIVRGIRTQLGPTINIRVDANMGWTSVKQALEMIQRLNAWNILSVEQPLAPRDIDGHRFLREHAEVPIMVDESVWGVDDAWTVIKHQAADIVNVYVAEAGGIYQAQRIMTVVDVAGLECAIGSMPEFGFGTAAQAHLGVAAPVLRHPSDVAGVLYQGDDLIQEPLLIKEGMAYPPERPGLGVDPDWEKIEYYRADQ